MKRGPKPGVLQNARDANGWMIPREGTIRRQVYDTLRAGLDRAEACAKLGLSADKYRLHCNRIKQAAPPKVETKRIRPCLCCQRDFESEWIGNRLCPVCANWDGMSVAPRFNRDSKQAGAV